MLTFDKDIKVRERIEERLIKDIKNRIPSKGDIWEIRGSVLSHNKRRLKCTCIHRTTEK